MGQGHGLLEDSFLQPFLHQECRLERARAAVRDGFAGTWLLPVAELGVGLWAGPQLWLRSWASPAVEVGRQDEDDTKLDGVTDMLDVCAAVWRDLDRLEK